MRDGAHTHHPGGSGLAVLLVAVAGLAVAAEAGKAIAAIVQALLIGLAAVLLLAVAGLITWAVVACRRPRPAPPRLIRARSWPGPAVMPVAMTGRS